GHWVAVGANRGIFAAAKLSRYCRLSIDYPVSTSEPAEFVDFILEFVRANQIDLVIPVTDWTLGPLSAERERFAGQYRLAMPSHAAVEFASDKFRTIELAQQIGIDVPKTHLIRSLDDLPACKGVGFPSVVKDRFSVRWIQRKAVFGSVVYAYSLDELKIKA